MLSLGNRRHIDISPWLPVESFTFTGRSPLTWLPGSSQDGALVSFLMFSLIWSRTVCWGGRDLVLDYSQSFVVFWSAVPWNHFLPFGWETAGFSLFGESQMSHTHHGLFVHVVSFLDELFWYLGAVTKFKKFVSWVLCLEKKKTSTEQHKNKSETDTCRGALGQPAYIKNVPLQTWELAKQECSGGKFYSPGGEDRKKNNLYFSS